MADLLIRDLDDTLVDHLKKNAERHGVTVEEEAKKILETLVQLDSRESLLAKAREIRERNAPFQKTNTLDLLREDWKF